VFKLHCFAVQPLPGRIAPEMKKRKAAELQNRGDIG
jgi:hypothetical protein